MNMLDTGWISSCAAVLLASGTVLMPAMQTHAGSEDAAATISSEKPSGRNGAAISLPPLAVVLEEDPGGNTWRETGEISGSLEITQKNFQRSLAREGWVLQRTIPLAQGPRRSRLCLWQRQGRELLVMLWQKKPGKCGFSWGITE